MQRFLAAVVTERHCRSRLPPVFATALVVLSLWTAAAAAQDAAPAAAAPPEPAIQAVPIEDIPEQAVRTGTALEALSPGDDSTSALQALAIQADELLIDIEVQLTDVELALAGTPKARSMQEWELELRRLLAPLDSLDKDLDRRLDGSRRALETLTTSAAQWEATREQAAQAEASESVRNRIDNTLASIEQVRQQLTAQRDQLLALRDRLVEPRADLERTLKRLRAQIEGRLATILERDRSMLWRVPLLEAVSAELQGGGSDSLAKRLQAVEDYARTRFPTIAFQLALFVGLAVTLRLLGSRATKLAEDDYDLRHASLVFASPISMALVISLSLNPLLHPDAPYLFTLLAYSLAVAPAALIVGRLLSTANRPIIWALLVAFLIDRVRDYLDTLPTLERGIFLLELVAGLIFLLWLRRPSRIREMTAEARKDPLFRVVRALTGISIALFAIAITAEVVGLGDLADLIGSGTLRSAYSALFIFALLQVLLSLIAYALIFPPLRLLKLVSDHRRMVRRRIETVLRLLALGLWAYGTLEFFGLDTPLKTTVLNAVNAELTLGALAISLGDVLVLIVTIWLTFALARLIDFVLTQDVYPRVNLPRGVPYAISTLTRYTLIFLGFLVALAAAGIELSKLTIVAGGLGVGIGFGLQNIVNNFVSGLILLFERPLKVRDDIQLGTFKGEIRRIGIRATAIRTDDGAEVIIPNSKLISEAVTNWTFRDRRRRLELSIVVKGGHDAQQVIDIILSAASQYPSVLSSPAPRAFFGKFSDSSLEFTLQVWIAEFRDEAMTRSDLTITIQKALAEKGIVDPLRKLSPEPGSEPDQKD